MSRTTFGFIAAGLMAVSLPILAATTIGARSAQVPGASQDPAIDTAVNEPTDFSARGRGGGGGGRGGGRAGGGGRGGGRVGGGGHGGGRVGGGGRGGGRVGSHTSGRVGGGRTGGGRTGASRTGGSRTGSARTGGTRTGGATGGRTGGTRVGGTATGGTRVGGTATGGTRTGSVGTRVGAATGGTRVGAATGGARVGTAGARVGGARVGAARVGSVTSIRNRRVTTFAGRRIWWHGGWRSLVGVSLLTGFAVGGDFFYPDGYVALAQPACTGYSDDGCALRWQDVAADDGSTIPQCVQFCPRVRSGSAPASAPATPAAAAAPRTGCEVQVFTDKNLAGGSFKTTEDQPLLNDQWDKQISSITVVSGTWDFATDPQYGGDAMRLQPGTYRDLGPQWDDQISSFMCVQ